MKRFFEDSSQAKILSSDRSIHKALRYFSKKPEHTEYELRDYSNGFGIVINTFATKQAALAAKSFHEIQCGCHFAVVAVTPHYYRLSNLEMEYIKHDKVMCNLFTRG